MKYNNSIPGPLGADHEEASYEGTFKAGKREGQGTMAWADGSIFIGTWKNNMRLEGEMRFQNGNLYKGAFLNDQLHGTGRLQMQSGVIYDGNFTQNSCDSVGKLLYPTGDVYYGQHREFVKEGHGKLINLNGSTYEGGWFNDRKHLNGRMLDTATGDIFIGDYLDGKRNGRGRMYYALKGEIYDGVWQNDRRQGEGFIVNRRGDVTSGEFRTDHIEGKVKYHKTLPQSETDKVFRVMQGSYDIFIGVEKSKTKLSSGFQTYKEVVTQAFSQVRKTIAQK